MSAFSFVLRLLLPALMLSAAYTLVVSPTFAAPAAVTVNATANDGGVVVLTTNADGKLVSDWKYTDSGISGCTGSATHRNFPLNTAGDLFAVNAVATTGQITNWGVTGFFGDGGTVVGSFGLDFIPGRVAISCGATTLVWRRVVRTRLAPA